jgi:hypothetical protein
MRKVSWYNKVRPKAIQSGAKGLDGGYEAQVACRGSITTQKDGTKHKRQ